MQQDTVLVAVLIAVALLLVGWTLVFLLRNVVIGAQTRTLLLSAPVALDSTTTTKITTANMPDSINGNTYTYLFWLRLDGYYQFSDEHKVLWYRAPQPLNALATPLVMLDGKSNAMYVLLATNQTPQNLTLNDVKGRTVDALRTEHRFAVVTMDYVPMTRWVHISVVVNDRFVTLTLNGDVYSNGTVDAYSGTARANNVRPYILPASGVLYVGGQDAVSGSITRLEYCNYPMMGSDIKEVYEAGVTGNSLMSTMGLPLYGLRNPIYRLNP